MLFPFRRCSCCSCRLLGFCSCCRAWLSCSSWAGASNLVPTLTLSSFCCFIGFAFLTLPAGKRLFGGYFLLNAAAGRLGASLHPPAMDQVVKSRVSPPRFTPAGSPQPAEPHCKAAAGLLRPRAGFISEGQEPFREPGGTVAGGSPPC